MNERLKTHSKTQKKSADLVSNKLRIGVFQQYQMKCKSVSKKSPRYTLEKFGYKDCPAHPTWLAPDEWKGTADEKQLQLLTAHPAHRLHSQLNYAELRKKYAVADREPITIHTEDAARFGIANGDLVRVWNKRGQILTGAVVTDGIKKGVVCVHEGAWPDLENGLCKNGSANVLTADIPSSQLANACAGNSALVYIEKYTGNAPKLTAFDKPAVQA